MSLSADNGSNASIVDIRRDKIDFSIKDGMHQMLRPGAGEEKRMPTMLLYNEKGLKLFEEITYLDEYYLTNAEIDVLDRYAGRIAERIEQGSQMIELGSGNLRKVVILLRALDKLEKNIDYYALDLSLSELQRTLEAVPPGTFKHVRCHGLLGTYDDGLEWLKMSENISRSKCIMFLGSSIGNFNRDDAAAFLKRFASVLGPRDSMLIGVDGCQDKEKVYRAYNDCLGKTHEFVRNGLTHANELLGKEGFKQGDWDVLGEYDVAAGRHQAFYVATKNVQVDGVKFSAGERVRIEESYKYSALQREILWDNAGLAEGAVFGDRSGHYHIHILSAPTFACSLDRDKYAANPVPTLAEYEQLWAAWDLVTRWMIPHEELLSKPIKLRNCCLFYLGHIPTFLDIHLTRATNGTPSEPSCYRNIFERGIDPDVDNPELCHAHSELPDSWPPAEEILAYQALVRERTQKLYKARAPEKDRKLGRALWIGFEHEVMHLETLLYMLLQSDKTVAPPGVRPDFEALATEACRQRVPNQWIRVPSSRVEIGLDDPENDDPPDRYFGWDNERPPRMVDVPTFEAKARGITNGEYAQYLQKCQVTGVPASWIVSSTPNELTVSKATTTNNINSAKPHMNGDGKPLMEAYLKSKAVRTVYGPVSLEYALDWPIIASYDEIAGCARWMGGRIPTLEETRSIYSYVDQLTLKDEGEVLASTIPAVNGHLSNEGVEESPPSHPLHSGVSSTKQSPDPKAFFVNLQGCNVGFKHFHPLPITQSGDKLAGQGQMGGVWEWTSSVLEKHEGFKPMDLYPAYTADFFDRKHNIMLGGSWATHPRVAGRKSFVNWYQRNYPYVWAGARVVRDLEV